MKKSAKKLLTIFVVLICVMGSVLPVNAAVLVEPSIKPLYVGTTSVTCNLSISESGKATCSTQVRLKSGYTAEETLKLQRSVSGSSWSLVKSWSTSVTSSALTLFSKSQSVSHGYYYRVQVILKVYDSSGHLAETITKTTSSIHY